MKSELQHPHEARAVGVAQRMSELEDTLETNESTLSPYLRVNVDTERKVHDH